MVFLEVQDVRHDIHGEPPIVNVDGGSHEPWIGNRDTIHYLLIIKRKQKLKESHVKLLIDKY